MSPMLPSSISYPPAIHPLGCWILYEDFSTSPASLTSLKKRQRTRNGYVVFRLTTNVPGARRKSSLTDYSAGIAVSTKTGI